MNYAGFWKRVAALIIDTLVLMSIGVAVTFIAITAGVANLDEGRAVPDVVLNLIGWTYFAAMESSSKQGTLGKMALGLKVTDLEGRRISFGRASGRYFAKIISTLILLIGYVMAAFTKKKQTLHDLMAGCLVVER